MKSLLLLLLCLFPLHAHAGEAQFSQFSMLLPEGWDGEEQTGFISDNPEEYTLTLGKKDAAGDKFLAQLTIYLLPNKPGTNAETAAKTLAEAQVDTTPPRQNGNFWQFTGEPRTRTIRGMATTMVNATPENLLIIIAQDPEQLGSEQILSTLKGETDRARKLLGR